MSSLTSDESKRKMSPITSSSQTAALGQGMMMSNSSNRPITPRTTTTPQDGGLPRTAINTPKKKGKTMVERMRDEEPSTVRV